MGFVAGNQMFFHRNVAIIVYNFNNFRRGKEYRFLFDGTGILLEYELFVNYILCITRANVIIGLF